MKLKASLLFFVLSTFSCQDIIDYRYIKSKTWNHANGFKIGKGDILVLNDEQKLFELKGDTIYYNGKPRALVKSLNKKYYNLTVTSLDGKEKGDYRNDDESFEH